MAYLEHKPRIRAKLTENAIDKRGSDCSGNDAAKNRVLTLANTSLTTGIIIWINGTMLHPTHDYTVSHLAAGTEITFLNQIYDDNYIDGFYFI